MFGSKDHIWRASQVLKKDQILGRRGDILAFDSLVKALATELASKKSLVLGRLPHQEWKPKQYPLGTFNMGQPSFQASNAIIYLTYAAFLCVRLRRFSPTERRC